MVTHFLVTNSDAEATCSQGKKRNVTGKRIILFATSSHVASSFYPSSILLVYTLPASALLFSNTHLDIVCNLVTIHNCN